MLGDRAMWSVLWLKGDTIIEKDCGNDLGEALRLYMLACGASKKNATLRCNNVGFPPPDKWRDKMESVNSRGWYWCPYCRCLRKFQPQGGFVYENVFVMAGGRYCPMCGVSERDFHVRAHNPRAAKYYARITSSRRRKGGRRNSRRSA